MEIIDISQELYSCRVFPGDKQPVKTVLDSIEKGAMVNASGFYMSAHNGTHVDAPFHFYKDGKTIEKLDLNAVVGKCYVFQPDFKGEITEESARTIVKKAQSADLEAAKRILIGGDIFVSLEAAKVFNEAKILLIGNEPQTVGPLNAPAKVHYELLKEEVVLLEGICLSHVEEGVYFLNAAPLNFSGNDGSPCRAILIRE